MKHGQRTYLFHRKKYTNGQLTHDKNAEHHKPS